MGAYAGLQSALMMHTNGGLCYSLCGAGDEDLLVEVWLSEAGSQDWETLMGLL